MRFVGAFFRFWIDFVIGDDWRVAAGVAVALTLGATLVLTDVVGDGAITLLSLAALVVGLWAGLEAERRKQA